MMRQAQKRPLRLRYVGSTAVDELEIDDQATIADLRESLNLDGLFYFASAETGQRLADEARIAEVLRPGEELLAARKAILG